jgi:hypothetical protein
MTPINNKNNMNLKKTLTKINISLVLAGLAASLAWASNCAADPICQIIPFKVTSGTGTGCLGDYTGSAKMTNGATTWLLPPPNATSVTFTNLTVLTNSYILCVMPKTAGGSSTCATNNGSGIYPSVTAPVTNSTYYAFGLFCTSAPPISSNTPITLQITWNF